jgi:uncharacterized membrane protein YhaH (DUF805 family)
MASEYYYLENGAQQGPVDQSQLVSVLTTRLTRDTLVWREGLAEWTAANQLPDLAALLAPPVPPLPAAAPPPPVVHPPVDAPAWTAPDAVPAGPAPSLNPFAVFGRTFSWTGKFNRAEFIVSILSTIGFGIVFGLFFGIAAAFGPRSIPVYVGAGLVGLVFIVAVTISGLGAVVRRVHDLGVSPWLMLLALVPIANFVWVIYLLVAPSHPAAPAEQPAPLAPIAVMLAIWGLFFLGGLAAVGIPAFYAAREQAQALDVQTITTSMTEGLQNQLSLEIASVTCPEATSGLKTGETVECVAIPTVGGRLTLKVSRQEGQKNVKWEVTNTEGLLDLQVVERAVAQGLKEQASVDATVTCGGKYRASTPGDVFDCRLKMADGRESAAAVTVADADGHISWEVKQ